MYNVQGTPTRMTVPAAVFWGIVHAKYPESVLLAFEGKEQRMVLSKKKRCRWIVFQKSERSRTKTDVGRLT